jgi:DNA-binding MarR family transcriptional regulator
MLRLDTDLNKLLHEPARLALMTALSSCESADFLFLQRLTGLTKGNLSSHLSKLEEAAFITITKQFVGKIPNTQVALTESGREAISTHWKQLDELRKGMSNVERRTPGSAPTNAKS